MPIKLISYLSEIGEAILIGDDISYTRSARDVDGELVQIDRYTLAASTAITTATTTTGPLCIEPIGPATRCCTTTINYGIGANIIIIIIRHIMLGICINIINIIGRN